MDEIALEQAEESRELLLDAQENGLFATLGAYTKLSGPGWLQSAITLGGGSLSGALFLGVLAWHQHVMAAAARHLLWRDHVVRD